MQGTDFQTINCLLCLKVHVRIQSQTVQLTHRLLVLIRTMINGSGITVLNIATNVVSKKKKRRKIYIFIYKNSRLICAYCTPFILMGPFVIRDVLFRNVSFLQFCL